MFGTWNNTDIPCLKKAVMLKRRCIYYYRHFASFCTSRPRNPPARSSFSHSWSPNLIAAAFSPSRDNSCTWSFIIETRGDKITTADRPWEFKETAGRIQNASFYLATDSRHNFCSSLRRGKNEKISQRSLKCLLKIDVWKPTSFSWTWTRSVYWGASHVTC